MAHLQTVKVASDRHAVLLWIRFSMVQ